jgi:DNA adenine methylase
MITPIKIHGSKAKLVDWILKETGANKETHWIEPFAGSGVVGLSLKPRLLTFCDNNSHLHAVFWSIFKGTLDKPELVRYLKEIRQHIIKDPSKHYYELRGAYNVLAKGWSASERAKLFLALNRLSFNGVVRDGPSGFNVPYGKNAERLSESIIESMGECVDGIKRQVLGPTLEEESANSWDHIEGDFRQTLENCNQTHDPSMIVYLDPPYLDRQSHYQTAWTKKDHDDLVDLLAAAKFKWALSTWVQDAKGKDSETLSGLEKYRVVIKDHDYKCGPKQDNRYAVKEALVLNY